MKSLAPKIMSICAIVLIWQIAAKIVDSPLILPFPGDVFLCLISLMKQSVFWQNVISTFFRVVKSFLISLSIGTVLGVACGKYSFIKDFLNLPISILRSTPVVALILVLIFAFSSDSVPVVVSVLMSIPVLISAISSGFTFSEDDKKMFQMAKVFNFSKRQRLFFLWIPKLKPFFKSGIVAVFGMSWKVTVAGEVLSLPKNALGTQLSTAQVHLESQEVFALALIIIALSFFMEGVLKILFESKNESKTETKK